MSAILRIPKSFLFWVLITAIAIGGIGGWIGYLISNAAQQNQTCSPKPGNEFLEGHKHIRPAQRIAIVIRIRKRHAGD